MAVVVGGGMTTNVVSVAAPPRILIREDYQTTSSKALGIFQCVTGGLIFIFGIVAMVYDCASAYSGYTIWGDIPTIVAGVLGIVAASNKKNSTITAYLALSIVSVLLMGLVCIIALVAITNDNDDYVSTGWFSWEENTDQEIKMAIDALIMVCAILAGVSLIWSSVVAGNCCSGGTRVAGTTVIHSGPAMNTVSTIQPMQQTTFVQQPMMIHQQPMVHQQPPSYGQQPGYVAQQPGYPPQQQPGYPPQQQAGYAAQQPGYPPQQHPQYTNQPPAPPNYGAP